MTRILISSASGVNGDGYGAVLSFAADGALAGPFSQDRRITGPRVSASARPANSYTSTAATIECLRSIGTEGSRSTRDGSTGSTRAGARSGPTAGTTSAYGGAGRSSPYLLVSTKEESSFFPTGSSNTRGGSASEPTVSCIWPPASVHLVKARTRSPCSTRGEHCARPASSATPNSALSISPSLPTGTSSSPASGHSAPATRRRASAKARGRARKAAWIAVRARRLPLLRRQRPRRCV